MRPCISRIQYNAPYYESSNHKSSCFCGIPVLDTSVPIVFQRERKVIPIVTTCPPLTRTGNKAFVWWKLFLWQHSLVCGSSEGQGCLLSSQSWEHVIVVRRGHLRERQRNNNRVWRDLKVIQRLASRGVLTEKSLQRRNQSRSYCTQSKITFLLFSFSLSWPPRQDANIQENRKTLQSVANSYRQQRLMWSNVTPLHGLNWFVRVFACTKMRLCTLQPIIALRSVDQWVTETASWWAWE